MLRPPPTEPMPMPTPWIRTAPHQQAGQPSATGLDMALSPGAAARRSSRPAGSVGARACVGCPISSVRLPRSARDCFHLAAPRAARSRWRRLDRLAAGLGAIASPRKRPRGRRHCLRRGPAAPCALAETCCPVTTGMLGAPPSGLPCAETGDQVGDRFCFLSSPRAHERFVDSVIVRVESAGVPPDWTSAGPASGGGCRGIRGP
jgi:hypothetical protein